MNIDTLDKITELETTLKQIEAIFDLFNNEYVNRDKKSSVLSVNAHFDSYQSTASVISDLIHSAVVQVYDLQQEP